MDKPLIHWNSQSEVRKPYKPNHICMFQERQLLEDVSKHAEYLKTENGFVARLKKYSSLYQDYMLYKHTLNDEIIPAGCIELCCNNLHVTKDLSMIPVLSTILNNVMPVSPFFLMSSRSISLQRKRRSQATKMAFSAIENSYLLTQPVLLIVGERADSEWQTERLYQALPGPDKEIYTIPGYSHIDLYDRPGAVNPAIEKLTAFFKRTLP